MIDKWGEEHYINYSFQNEYGETCNLHNSRILLSKNTMQIKTQKSLQQIHIEISCCEFVCQYHSI